MFLNKFYKSIMLFMGFLLVCCNNNNTETLTTNNGSDITSFELKAANNAALSKDIKATIDMDAKTVKLTVPSGTDVTALKAYFELSEGATASVKAITQKSGVTANDFTNPVTYTITAEDKSTKNYTVTVTKEASSAKNMSTFKFRAADNSALSRDVNGSVNNTANTVALTVPSGTDVTALKAYFELSAGASAKIGSTVQQSGVTANNFTNALTYTITAVDNSTKNYTVTVTKEAGNAKNMSTFKFRAADNSALSRDVNGNINNTANTVALTVPSGTDVTALKAYFELSAGASAKIGSIAQQSGVTANNFTNALTYTITAVDNSTKNYTVTVTIASGSVTPTGPTNLKKGYGNSSYHYFYYPTDGKIYYSSKYHIYKMDLDGSNSVKIKDKTSGVNYPSSSIPDENVYVYNDWVYYNNYTEKKIYKMRRDGTSHSLFLNDAYGDMKIVGDYFYFSSGNRTLKRIKVDKSEAEETIHRERGYKMTFGVRGNAVYYHKGDDWLYKVDLATKTKTTLSSGLNDGFIFEKTHIYYRDHSNGYGISKSDYDMQNEVLIRRTTQEIRDDGNRMNLSDDFFCYVNRVPWGSSGSINLYFVSRDGSTETKLVDNIQAEWPNQPKLIGEFRIIGNWIYYLINTSGQVLEISRIKKDGTGKAVVKRL